MPSPTTRTCATSRIFSLIRCKSSLILGPRGPRGNGGRGPPGFGAPGFGRLKNGAAMLTSGFKLVLLLFTCRSPFKCSPLLGSTFPDVRYLPFVLLITIILQNDERVNDSTLNHYAIEFNRSFTSILIRSANACMGIAPLSPSPCLRTETVFAAFSSSPTINM